MDGTRLCTGRARESRMRRASNGADRLRRVLRDQLAGSASGSLQIGTETTVHTSQLT